MPIIFEYVLYFSATRVVPNGFFLRDDRFFLRIFRNACHTHRDSTYAKYCADYYLGTHINLGVYTEMI